MPPSSQKRWRASETIQKRARELRRDMTPAEQILWQALRGNALDGAYFRRQHAIGVFILDFYCAKSKLAVEVDGGVHLGQQVHDAERARWLESEHGIHIIRFTNEDVLQRLDAVLNIIRDTLTKSPPPARGGS